MADAFNFRLEPVLEYRRRLEDEKKQEFSRAKADEHMASEKLSDLEDQFDEGQGEMAGVRSGQIDSCEVAVYQRYLDRLKQDISSQAQLVTVLHAQSEERRVEAVEGMKARKVVERLKERQLDQFKVETNRVEQRQIDEFATIRYKGPGARM